MTTVDTLLLSLVSQTSSTLEENIPHKDARVLRSLASTLTSGNFITENQSRLLIKILTSNKNYFSSINSETTTILTEAKWSKSFRIVTQIRKLYVQTGKDEIPAIFAEFTFSSTLRKLFNGLIKNIEGPITTLSTKLFSMELTEGNIVTLVETLEPHKFEIDQKIRNFYENIKKWQFEESCQHLVYGEKLLPVIQNAIDSDILSGTELTENLIIDRSVRFQYLTEKTEKNEENLENVIARRSTSRVWIDSKKYSLPEIFETLVALQRLPTLVVFDGWNTDQCLENLQKLAFSLEKTGLDNNVGIYFRLPNEESGKQFNAIIGDKKYNSVLDNSTIVAGVQAGKLPKFFLKDCNWSPKSVIVLGSSLRHSKTAVYSNRCDLIITYNDKPSIYDSQQGWTTNSWVL